jgi:hypothetical protein
VICTPILRETTAASRNRKSSQDEARFDADVPAIPPQSSQEQLMRGTKPSSSPPGFLISRRQVLAAGLVLAAGPPAFALDPGAASGFYRKDGLGLKFSHATVLLQDDVEGVLDHPKQLRVVLSDGEVPVEALCGLMFPPVRAMAREGKVRGLMLEFDPADRQAFQGTVLSPPEPGASLASLSFSNSEGLWAKLDVGATRASGELKPDDDGELAASFDAPVFTDDVQTDLKGATAQGSEPVKILLARAEAMARGDMAAAMALSTPESAAEARTMPPEVQKMMAQQMPAFIREVKGAKRVVIRRQTAAVQVASGDWASLRRQDGAWKAAD